MYGGNANVRNKKIIRVNKALKEAISLDENGLKYRANGLPERNFLGEIKHPTPLSIIEKRSHNYSDDKV